MVKGYMTHVICLCVPSLLQCVDGLKAARLPYRAHVHAARRCIMPGAYGPAPMDHPTFAHRVNSHSLLHMLRNTIVNAG